MEKIIKKIKKLLKLTVKQIQPIELEEVDYSLNYRTEIGLVHLVKEKELYIITNGNWFKVIYNDLKFFYSDYDETGQYWVGFKIDNHLYFNYRDRLYNQNYNEFCNIDNPLYDRIKHLLI